ncbi:RNA polymerase sigma factor [Lentzea sp. NPDC051838]|uniref:RNA polymerase sigma factor n=1 Tax=Lentzea sp. NPDC051838 TaxID=3154849 RepID=UPI0034407586
MRSAAGFGDGGEISGVAWSPRLPSTAEEVLTSARRGDEDAFRALYRDVQPKLLRYLQVLVGADADDVASDAWLQIARDLGTFRGDLDGFRGWATTIARNRALDHLRRQQRRPVVLGTVDDVAEPASREDTAQSAVDSITTDAALALIARLPRDQAEAVLLRAVVGLDSKAAAKVLGKRPGAVRTAAHRGLRTLASYLEESPPPGKTPQE